MTQLTLYRTSILAKFHGCLVLIQVDPSKTKSSSFGVCPQCNKGKTFREGTGWDADWTVCCGDECDFAILTAHIKEIESQWAT